MTRDNKNYRLIVSMLIVLFVAAMVMIFSANFAQGQDNPDFSQSDFSGGVNTNTNPLLLKPNELVQAHNWLLDAEFGSLVLRNGDLARTDTLDKTIPSPVSWNCIIDTIQTLGQQDAVYFTCDSTLPPQDRFWDGLDADSLDRDATPPPAWTGKDFTIANSFFNQFTSSPSDSSGLLVSFNSDVDLVKGDSLQVTMSTLAFTQAFDTGGVTGVYAFYSKPTTKMLLYVIPGFGSQNQWSSLYASESQNYNPIRFLSDFIYKGETPLWETWNGFAYVALPRQRPMVTNGRRTSHLIPRAPGQLEIVPIVDSHSISGIDGVVQYGLFLNRLDTAGTKIMDRVGYLSHEVPLFNEHALLYAFPRPVADSANNRVRSDTIQMYITRTRGNPKFVGPLIDSLFLIDSIFSNDVSILDTLTFRDTIPNDSLGISPWVFIGTRTIEPRAGIIPYDTGFVDSITDILDITLPIPRGAGYTALGAPVFIAHNMTTTDDADWWPVVADTAGAGNQFHVGWEYGVTKFDTTFPLPLMSAMSPSLTVSTSKPAEYGGQDSTIGIDIGIAPLTAFDTNQVRVMWRRQIKFEPNADSFKVLTDTFFINDEGRQVPLTNDIRFRSRKSDPPRIIFKERILFTDTILTKSAYRPVGVLLNGAETLFNDSVTWTDWISGGRTDQSVKIDPRFNPTDNRMDIVKGFFAFKDNLFAWTDDRLFRSTLDTPVFKPFQDVKFDPERGDVIVQVAQIGPNLVVFFSDGLIELFDPVGTLPTKGSPVSGFGCVAPQSLINYGGTVYFLAKDGIRTISSHPVKNFGVANKIISTKINNLIVDGRSDSLKSTMAAGIGTDGKTIVFAYPSIDTMFIYYPELDAWTTRDGSFFQATNYDTTSIEGLLRSSKMVYAKSGDERVFEMYASPTYLDSGINEFAFSGVFETRPFFADHNLWQVAQVGLLGNASKNRTVDILDDTGLSVSSATFLAADPVYTIRGFAPHEGSYLSLKYSTNITAITEPDTLRRIDIWGRPIGRSVVK